MSVGFTFFHFSPLYRMSEAGLEALIQAAQFLEENGGETRLCLLAIVVIICLACGLRFVSKCRTC